MTFILCVIVSYLIGSIPTGYLFARFIKGTDIRQHGSGNVGATNVFRVMGKGYGSTVLAMDIFKGLIVVALVPDLFGLNEILHRLILAIVVVCGHNWSVFLKFKGGKGIATSLGVLIGLTIKIASFRIVLIVVLGLFLAVFLITGIVSLGSLVAATALPIVMVFTGQDFEVVFLGVIFCIFVVLRHKANIKRLLSGAEPRIKLPFRNKK